ncbi:hypothetical protein MMIN_27730 [Mycolicibacter minnesotensis]|nr:hypothetical protein MMIN_27730 [Mycolicibacter minnesotensis]
MTRKLCLAQDPEADELLAKNPFALLTGMLLDQQISMERAFAGPKKIAERLARNRVDTSQPSGIALICYRTVATDLHQVACLRLADSDLSEHRQPVPVYHLRFGRDQLLA